MLDAVGSGTRDAGDGRGEGANEDRDGAAETFTVIEVAVDALGTTGVRRIGTIDNAGMLDMRDDDDVSEEAATEAVAAEDGATYSCATSRGTYSDTRFGRAASDAPAQSQNTYNS